MATRPKDPPGMTLLKETTNYYHYVFKNVKVEDMDPASFQTVNLPTEDKIIIARHKRTKDLWACQLLRRK